ncbi:MAG TPA: GTP-binding protein [Planctomycetota bacterium]|nr:GTP-binding protein [Planctomycetota bacterium]
MSKARLVLVGGFLGAGKTTLMAQAGRRLAAQGRQVGFITNDQAAQLVDTELLKQTGFDVKEVAGACFCCKFDELIGRTDEFLAERKPDILISEPVGSCTDLSATVLQPVKKFFGDRFRVAPFSVVTDPLRLRMALSGKASVFTDSVLYIYGKQLEEADIIVLNKIDQLTPDEINELKAALAKKFPGTPVVAVSAITGDGIDAWLELIQQDRPAGTRIAEIDYDTYADGEAVLGWLNASVKLRSQAPVEWRGFAFNLLRAFKDEFSALKAEVAHVKLSLNAPGTGLVGNLTSSRGMPFVLVQGKKGEPTAEALLIVNARVHITPEQLRPVVEKVISACGIEARIETLECFSPGRPKPTHRFKDVVAQA